MSARTKFLFTHSNLKVPDWVPDDCFKHSVGLAQVLSVVHGNEYRLDDRHDLFAHTLHEARAQLDRLEAISKEPWNADTRAEAKYRLCMIDLVQPLLKVLARDSAWPATPPWPEKDSELDAKDRATAS